MHYIVCMRVNGIKQLVIIDSLDICMEYVVNGAKLVAFSESIVEKELLKELIIASKNL